MECLLLTSPNTASVEVLGDAEVGLQDVAVSSVAYVFNLIKAGRLQPTAFHTWPLAAGQHVQVYFNFPPASDRNVGVSTQGAMTLALISALTGRAHRKGVLVVGEHTADGRLLPVVSASVADLRVMQATEGLKTMLVNMQFAHKLKSLMRREASPVLRMFQVEVVGGETIDDFIELALEPSGNQE